MAADELNEARDVVYFEKGPRSNLCTELLAVQLPGSALDAFVERLNLTTIYINCVSCRSMQMYKLRHLQMLNGKYFQESELTAIKNMNDYETNDIPNIWMKM